MTCQWCELEPAEIKVTLTDLDGVVLDTVALCEECRNQPISVKGKCIDQS